MRTRSINWQPYRVGFVISTALLSAASSAVILAFSNNCPVDSWPKLAPTVLLAISSVIANISIQQILSEGLPIRWWLEANHRGGTVEDLRRIYDHGFSAWSSICSFCIAKPTTAALACLSVTAMAVNGPLLQRASHVDNQFYTSDAEIMTGLAVEWPMGFSGIKSPFQMTNWDEPVEAFTPLFASVVGGFSDRNDITLNDTGCVGTCQAKIEGAGFALDCSQGTYDYNITVDLSVGHPVYLQMTGFSSTVSLVVPNSISASAIIEIDTLFKNSTDVSGKGTTQNCSLIPSIVRYSVEIENSTVKLLGTIRDDTVIKPVHIFEAEVMDRATLGGLVFVGQQKYNSNAQILWQGSRKWIIQMNGSLAYQFQNLAEDSGAELGISGEMTWGNPTEIMIQGIRELMFRSAIATGNSSLPPSVSAGLVNSFRQVYKTDFLFMGLGVAAIMIGIFGTIPLLWDGWVLQEDVDLDPIRVVVWAKTVAGQGKGVYQYRDVEIPRAEVEKKHLLRIGRPADHEAGQ